MSASTVDDDAGLRHLALTCTELNYRNPLVHDSVELRAAVVAALTRGADVLDGLAACGTGRNSAPRARSATSCAADHRLRVCRGDWP